MVLVFLEDIYLPCIHLDMKSTAFVGGTLLDTTNTERFSIVIVFLANPFQPSDLPAYIFRGVEIQTE